MDKRGKICYSNELTRNDTRKGAGRMRIDVLGVGFDNLTMDEAIEATRALLSQGEGGYCVTPNSEIVYEATRDEPFRALLNGASLVLPDGVGILLGAKLLKTPLKEKVAGVDYAERLCALLAELGKPLYLLGGKPGIAEQAAGKLRERYPSLQLCGIADGYFQDEGAVVAAVQRAGPAVLFVCLGSPKQEHFIRDHRRELGGCFLVGLGGTLDAVAGTVKRAPAWMQKLGLEWFYRLLKEPRRFKRQLRLPRFVFAVLGKRLKGG